ncbi:hypothetical protein [Nocardia wallacei]|uniref:hypothetical protein n=1 Tax=Nocardia wallacei TaxID=480035 RepID=UPI00245710ED|nr:hypothetical protein [Nocardia wallacei]
MSIWYVVSSIVATLTACGFASLAVGCVWPSEQPPESRPTRNADDFGGTAVESTDTEPNRPPLDDRPARFLHLATRAARAGYHLTRTLHAPYEWRLLDTEDGETIYTAPTLEQVERWLNS